MLEGDGGGRGDLSPYVDWGNSPLNHVYFLNDDNIEKSGSCGAHIGLSSCLNTGLENGGSDAAITNGGYYWGENEQMYGTNAVPRTTEDHKLFKKIWIHASRLVIKRGQENLEWEGVIGSLIFATMKVSFDSFKLTQLLWFGV